MRLFFGIACAALALISCSSGYQPPTLDGTSWQLITLESMDDRQGTTTVPDPGKYTVTFGTDGRAAFQIDCNRGSASWQAKPSATEASGELTFGPIAVTRMACLPPSIDQQVSTWLTYVRGYLIKNGRLHLSLYADGGILTWEPLHQ